MRVKTLMGLERFEVENFKSEKNSNVATGTGASPIKNCCGTIEGLFIGFNFTEGIFTSQNPYGFKAMYLVL